MATGSGLASQLGVVKDVTYGTRQAPAKFYEYNSESLQIHRNRIGSRGLRAGRLAQNSTRVATVSRKWDGGLNLEIPNQGFGTILDLLHGLTPTVVQQGGTAAWLQTHLLATSDPNKSATFQVGTPDIGGTVRVYEYVSGLVSAFKFSCQQGGFLECELTLDGQDRTTSQALASASYPSNLRSYHFGQSSATINSVAYIDVFDSVEISGVLKRNTDRFKIGGILTQAKPILSDYYDMTIAFGGDFKDLSFTTLFDADTLVPITVKFNGPVIAGSYTEFIEFTATACMMDDQDPDVSGPDVVQQPLSFSVYDDSSNAPLTVKYMSLDTAI